MANLNQISGGTTFRGNEFVYGNTSNNTEYSFAGRMRERKQAIIPQDKEACKFLRDVDTETKVDVEERFGIIVNMDWHCNTIANCVIEAIIKAMNVDMKEMGAKFAKFNFYDLFTAKVTTKVNETAEKEGILQLQDGTQYHFLIVSAVDINGNRKQTKAFIQKNGEELNSNGNISSYKEIIDTEFDMDPNFMTLTRLSSDDRGLADKKPAERKKYVSAIVSCLETYNGINKALVKKSSIFRSHINSLSSKISTIGDLDSARMNLQALDGRMVSLQKYMSDTQAEIARCQSKVDIIDKDGKIQDEYTNIANSVDEINKAIENINSSIRYRMEKLKLDKVDSVDAEIESCRQSIR